MATFALLLSLLFIAPYTKREILETIKQPNLLIKLLAISVIHYGLGTVFILSGTALTSAANVGFLSKTATFFALIEAQIFLGEKINRIKLLSLVTAMLGTFLLVNSEFRYAFTRRRNCMKILD